MFDGQPLTMEFYQTAAGAEPLSEWLNRLKDHTANARIRARLTRMQTGNPGDYKTVGQGLYELRIDCGPGYRVYFAFSGDRLILLLCGGTKSSQAKDSAAAKRYWPNVIGMITARGINNEQSIAHLGRILDWAIGAVGRRGGGLFERCR